MKKSPYINKYDFIAYYTKQPSFWFFSDAEVLSKIHTELKQLEIDLNEDETEIDEDISFDAYEFYKEQKELLKDINKNDPRIVEGLIIDKTSREFITKKYQEIENIVDFESKEYACYQQEYIAELTKKMILENENIILFQPVFIHEKLITKPDAIVKCGNEITLIETKSTTTSKLQHFLDIYFQNKVLTAIDYLDDYWFDLNLCLVAYNKANKYEVNFILTDCVVYTSSPASNKKDDIWTKQLLKIGKGIMQITKDKMRRIDCDYPITFNSLCNEDFSELTARAKILNANSLKWLLRFEEHLKILFNDFEKIITTLLEHKQKLIESNRDEPGEIVPSPNEKSYWKKSSLCKELWQIYYKKGYELFKFSGKVVKQTASDIVQYLKVKDHTKFYLKDVYYDYYEKNYIYFKLPSFNFLLSKLKDKKVYFDFETINSPIRPIDNCLPFMQILTQCSIIIDDNTKPINEVECNNILVDPKDIKIDDFKHVIDCLYMGNEYSYVVYNKGFECSRLKEMANFINEEIYHEKVNVIINNIYDLADFFDVSRKEYGCLVIKELYGWYSIKKVLPIVMKYRRDIFDATGCVDYHSLDVVQNGLICQSETTKRFHNILSDEEWEKLSVNLKKYCENDVRAMIAVEYYIKSLI